MTAPSKLAPSEAVREAIAFAIGTREYDSPKSKVSFWDHLGGYYKDLYRSSADAALAAIAAQGLVLVPVEPTEAMVEAAVKGSWADVSYNDVAELWPAMLAAVTPTAEET